MLSTPQAVQLSWRINSLRAIVDRRSLYSAAINFVQTSLLLLFCGQPELKYLAEMPLVHSRPLKYISLLILRLSSSFPLLKKKKPSKDLTSGTNLSRTRVCKIVSKFCDVEELGRL